MTHSQILPYRIVALATVVIAGCSGESSTSHVMNRPDASQAAEANAPSCSELTCKEVECGQAPDGCGGVVTCGGCDEHMTCGGGGANRCGTKACQPATCDMLNVQCGYASDGCSLAVDCGVCPMDKTCVQGKCVCKPASCASRGWACGSGSDGCGAELQCGSCASGQTCSEHACVAGTGGGSGAGGGAGEGGQSTGGQSGAGGTGGSSAQGGSSGSSGCPETCIEGTWCNSGTCTACNTDAHCGVSCDNCTAQANDRMCIGFGCGCVSTAHCSTGMVCNPETKRCCAANCSAGCGSPDGCGGICECAGGQWCNSGTCSPCNTAQHCGPACVACSPVCGTASCVGGVCSSSGSCCDTSDAPNYSGNCGMGVAVQVPDGCVYRYESISQDTFSGTLADWVDYRCEAGTWVLELSDGDGGACHGCPSIYKDTWSDTCGNASARQLTCPK